MTDADGPFLIELGGVKQLKLRLAAIPEGAVILGNGPLTVPIENGEWNGTRWLVPMPLVRLHKWQEIKGQRDEQKAAGCDTPFGRVDTDPESINQILLAAAEARETPLTFSRVWTLADDTNVTLTATDMRALLLAVTACHRDLHATARQLREEIIAAPTRVAIEAVAWPTEP